MNILLFLAGLAALLSGPNYWSAALSKLALSFGISPLVVGLTIVAFGTSAPELAVSVGAGWKKPTLPSAMWWAAIYSTCFSSWA